MLYIVATPIGNLEDITFRAVRVLKECDLVLCEDTRQTQKLLNAYEIKKPLLSYHSYSGITKLDKIISELKSGKNICLVSDAGTPGISDPGFVLIREALNLGIEVVPIPGPSAFLTGLQASGMPINHFLYLGFLPLKNGKQKLLKSLSEKEYSVVIYESVHRILKTLNDLENTFGGGHFIVIGAELTKKFERFFRGNISEAKEYFSDKSKLKGEFVIIF